MLVPDGQGQSLTKASSFPINLSVFRKHVCQVPGARPGMLMPSPRGRDKIANAPPPGLTTWANAPRLPGGDGHRWNWCITRQTQVERSWRLFVKWSENKRCTDFWYFTEVKNNICFALDNFFSALFNTNLDKFVKQLTSILNFKSYSNKQYY